MSPPPEKGSGRPDQEAATATELWFYLERFVKALELRVMLAAAIYAVLRIGGWL
jgi:hypothetical protein